MSIVKYSTIKAAVLILLILLVKPGLSSAGAGAYTPEKKILDMHAHIAGIGAGNSGCFISEAMRNSWKFRIYLKSFGVSEKEVKESGDSIIIKRLSEELSESEYVRAAVILAMDGVVDDKGELDLARTEFYIPNEYVAGEIKKYDNLYFGASINPFRRDAVERLDMAVREGAVLVKWLPSIQFIDPSDKRIVPFYLRLKEHGLPLLTHAGDEHSFTKAKNEFADPQRLHLPLKLGVTVIAAHAGTSGKNEGIDNMQRLLPMFDEYPNLYADISSLTQINKMRYLGKLLKHKNIHGRLLYGTDMPLIKTGLTSPLFHIFKLSPREFISLLKTDNPWDRDVRLKKALGVPEGIFTNADSVIKLGYVKEEK
jgi:predicted TIM-barrel fold metal-dependent hydrolase